MEDIVLEALVEIVLVIALNIVLVVVVDNCLAFMMDMVLVIVLDNYLVLRRVLSFLLYFYRRNCPYGFGGYCPCC